MTSRIFPAGGRGLAGLIAREVQHALAKAQGWAHYIDGTHTSGSPQALTAATRAQWVNDGATALEEFRPNGSPLWSGDKIVPSARGSAYTLRIDFTIAPSGPNGIFTLDLDIGTDPFGVDSNKIVVRNIGLAKGASVQAISVGFPIYCLDDFVANGGVIGVTSSVDADIYDKAIMLVQVTQG